jgi:hypothetical protein
MFCVPARPSSDIDIGIEGPEEISARIKLEIEEELDNLPTLGWYSKFCKSLFYDLQGAR